MNSLIDVEITVTGIDVEAASREHAEQIAMCLVTKALANDPDYQDFGDQMQAEALSRPGLIVKPVRSKKHHEEVRT
jgi:hypothetical protein